LDSVGRALVRFRKQDLKEFIRANQSPQFFVEELRWASNENLIHHSLGCELVSPPLMHEKECIDPIEPSTGGF